MSILIVLVPLFLFPFFITPFMKKYSKRKAFRFWEGVLILFVFSGFLLLVTMVVSVYANTLASPSGSSGGNGFAELHILIVANLWAFFGLIINKIIAR